jgi:large subunit ribosomal protein L30
MTGRCILAIRIRSSIGATEDVKSALMLLRLGKTNYATLLDDRPSYVGMLRQVKERITWGEADAETILELLKKRGEVPGGHQIDENTLNELGYSNLEELSKALCGCEVEFSKLRGVKPFFRLHPPSKGFRGKTKHSYGAGGEAGYRGEKINELASKMM